MGRRIRCISCLLLTVCVPIGTIAVIFAFYPIQNFPPPPRPEFISFGVVVAGMSIVLRCTSGFEGSTTIAAFPVVTTQRQIELITLPGFAAPENIIVQE